MLTIFVAEVCWVWVSYSVGVLQILRLQDFMEAAAPSASRWIRSRLACVQNACKMGIRKRLVSA